MCEQYGIDPNERMDRSKLAVRKLPFPKGNK